MKSKKIEKFKKMLKCSVGRDRFLKQMKVLKKARKSLSGSPIMGKMDEIQFVFFSQLSVKGKERKTDRQTARLKERKKDRKKDIKTDRQMVSMKNVFERAMTT